MKIKLFLTLAAVAAVTQLPAHADTLVVDLNGWAATGDFGDPRNTGAFFSLPAGSTVTGFDYTGLVFIAAEPSWRDELVLSLNNYTGAPQTVEAFMDWAPSDLASPGAAGPLSGRWGGATGVPGPYGAGGAFTVGGGADNLWVTVFDSVPDAVVPNVAIASGLLTIHYTAPIPEPATYGLMALGLLGLAGVARLRHSN